MPNRAAAPRRSHPIFTPECDRAAFTDDEWEQLLSWGRTLQDAEDGTLQSPDPRVQHFVRVCRGQEAAAHWYEHLWLKYRAEVTRGGDPDLDLSAFRRAVCERPRTCGRCTHRIEHGSPVLIHAKTGIMIHRRCPDSSTWFYASSISEREDFVFHRASCTWVAHMRNPMVFKTREEAVRVGYRPCAYCRP
jgi:hypothetical protein